jgi:SOS-response transcriptional repressor LexA
MSKHWPSLENNFLCFVEDPYFEKEVHGALARADKHLYTFVMKKSDTLSPRQRSVLDAIVRVIRDQAYPPSIREIGDITGIKSPRGVSLQLDALEARGYIARGSGDARAITILKRANPGRMRHSKEKAELDSIRAFIKHIRNRDGIRLRLMQRPCPIKPASDTNFDALLTASGNRKWAVELTELVESEEAIQQIVAYSELQKELRVRLRVTKRPEGCFRISIPLDIRIAKAKIPAFAESLTPQILAAMAQLRPEEESTVASLRIKRFRDDLRLGLVFGGSSSGWISPVVTMKERLLKAITDKSPQLAVDWVDMRVIVVRNRYHSGDRKAAIEAFSSLDLAAHPHIDRVYIQFNDSGPLDLVYERGLEKVRSGDGLPTGTAQRNLAMEYLPHLAARDIDGAWASIEQLLSGVEAHEAIPEPDKRHWLCNVAAACAKNVVELEGQLSQSAPKDSHVLRERQKTALKRTLFLIDRMKRDPDPSLEGSGCKYHAQIAEGKDPGSITSIRGRLCWVLQDLALVRLSLRQALKLTLELLKYRSPNQSIGEHNLYVIQQALVPLAEIAARVEWLSASERRTVHQLSFALLDAYSKFPGIATYLATLFSNYRNISSKEAARVLTGLKATEAAAPLFIYFSSFHALRPNVTFEDESIRKITSDAARNSSIEFRASIAWHLMNDILSSHPHEFGKVSWIVDELLAGQLTESMIRHLLKIADDYVATDWERALSWTAKVLDSTSTLLQKTKERTLFLHGIAEALAPRLLVERKYHEYMMILDRLVSMAQSFPNFAPLNLETLFKLSLTAALPSESSLFASLDEYWRRFREARPAIEFDWKRSRL